jgi:type IV pilus assembly protein PilC
MTLFVLPKLMSLFEEFDSELPLATKILMNLVNFLSNPIYLSIIVLSTFFIIFLFVSGLKKNAGFRRMVHRANLHLPIVGPVIKQVNLARFSLTLSSLLKSTIPIVEAVGISGLTCSNVLYQESLHKTSKELKKGKPLSEILSKYNKLFPPMVTEMIMVGEKSGEVDHLLDELADFYSDEVDKTMKNFSTIIEPIIILVLGVAVAGIAVAVVMPMYSLVQNF